MSTNGRCVGDALLDELEEHAALVKRKRHRSPMYQVTAGKLSASYYVIVEVDGEVVADCAGRTLASAQQKALDHLRTWVDDQSSSIERALEVSLKEARQ